MNCPQESVYISYEDTDDGDFRVTCDYPAGHPGFHWSNWHEIWWASKDHPAPDRFVWNPEE